MMQEGQIHVGIGGSHAEDEKTICCVTMLSLLYSLHLDART